MLDHSEAIGLAEVSDLAKEMLMEFPLSLPAMLSVSVQSVCRRPIEEHVKRQAKAPVLGTWSHVNGV